MALSDERIWDSDAIMRANAAAGLPMPLLGMLCRTIEAEVCKQDEALIRQLVEALGGSIAITMGKIDLRNAAITAARARLEGKP
ncbi:MAG: hypothetical protein ACD_85C00001G0001 [uncultured bacterium]|nr:MAG: hypothetical protein ACD_85C00001G0001 [uncultured bacterium]